MFIDTDKTTPEHKKLSTTIIRKISALLVASFIVAVMGCASPNLKAPCPNYGSSCQKIPVNNWNTNI